MSLEEIREQNKEKVAAVALEHFMKNGIEPTKISDVAKAAGLNSRSVYRYFDTKAQLVLAAALLFWQQTVNESEKVWAECEKQNLTGEKQIETVLKAYANQYFNAKEKLIFTQEAEVYLHRNEKILPIKNRPTIAFSQGKGPLNQAIRNGVKDGSVKKSEEELEMLYYNAYDSLLGLMEKMATSNRGQEGYVLNDKTRISAFCEMLAHAFCI